MEKSWFIDRIGKTVIRTYNDQETEFEVTEKNVGYLWLFTEKGYTFKEATVSKMETAGDDDWLEAAKPVLRIHKVKEVCISCEG